MTIENLDLYTWFERDRAHVELRNKETDKTLIEFWDNEVGEMVEDGFLDPCLLYTSDAADERSV